MAMKALEGVRVLEYCSTISGPYEDYKAHALNVSQVSGQGYLLPLPSPHLERAPAMVGASCTDYDSGQTVGLRRLRRVY